VNTLTIVQTARHNLGWVQIKPDCHDANNARRSQLAQHLLQQKNFHHCPLLPPSSTVRIIHMQQATNNLQDAPLHPSQAAGKHLERQPMLASVN
jgi:hypothetical protein